MSSADTAFKLFDKDRDGFITRAEFAKVIFYDGYGFDGGRYGWDAVDDCLGSWWWTRMLTVRSLEKSQRS